MDHLGLEESRYLISGEQNIYKSGRKITCRAKLWRKYLHWALHLNWNGNFFFLIKRHWMKEWLSGCWDIRRSLPTYIRKLYRRMKQLTDRNKSWNKTSNQQAYCACTASATNCAIREYKKFNIIFGLCFYFTFLLDDHLSKYFWLNWWIPI